MRRSSITGPHNRSGRDAESKGSSCKMHPAATSGSTQKQAGPATATDSSGGGVGGCSVFPSPLGSRSGMRTWSWLCRSGHLLSFPSSLSFPLPFPLLFLAPFLPSSLLSFLLFYPPFLPPSLRILIPILPFFLPHPSLPFFLSTCSLSLRSPHTSLTLCVCLALSPTYPTNIPHNKQATQFLSREGTIGGLH